MTTTKPLLENSKLENGYYHQRPFFSIENIFLFWMLMISVSATPLTRDWDPRVNPLGVLITLVLSTIVYIKHNVRLSRNVIIVCLVIGIWIVWHYFNDIEFMIIEYLSNIIKIILAYIIIVVFKTQIWKQFHDLVYRLTIIDLIMWGVQLIVGTSTLKNYSFLPSTGTSLGSFLVYSISNQNMYEGLGLFGLIRNCGFCWEPGFYACVLLFAIFANFIIYNNTWRKNKELYVLIFALITTSSTTGYSGFFILVITSILFRGGKFFNLVNLTAIITLIIVFLVSVQLPFMQEKIGNQFDKDNYLTEQEYGIRTIDNYEQVFTVGRFEGMALDLMNIQDKPWFGYGIITNSFIYNNLSENLRISNGTTTLVSKYGFLLGGLFLFFLILNSIRLRTIIPTCRNSWFLFFAFVSISYNFLNFTLFISFAFYSFFYNRKTESSC